MRPASQILQRNLFRHNLKLYSSPLQKPCNGFSSGWSCARAFALQRRYQGISAGHTQDAPQTRRHSLLRRVLIALVGAPLCLALGVFLGWQSLASKPQLVALLSKQASDDESLASYTPSDDASAAINSRILQHPLAVALRSNPDYIESRPHLKLPDAVRRTNLTGGTLSGPGRIVVPPLQFVERSGKTIVSIFYLGADLCGHPGLIHGGLLATLLDEGLARCCFPALPNGIGVTAHLKVDYRQPVQAEGYYILRAHTERVEGRKAWVNGWIEPMSDEEREREVEEGEEVEMGTVKGGSAKSAAVKTSGNESKIQKLVEANALFIEPRNAHLMKRIYQA